MSKIKPKRLFLLLTVLLIMITFQSSSVISVSGECLIDPTTGQCYSSPGDGDGGGSGDSTDPTVSITSPSEGSEQSGTFYLEADASDSGSGIDEVVFYIDGSFIASDSSSPYRVSWDSTTVGDGSHTLRVVAQDLHDNDAEDSVSFTTENYNPLNYYVSMSGNHFVDIEHTDNDEGDGYCIYGTENYDVPSDIQVKLRCGQDRGRLGEKVQIWYSTSSTKATMNDHSTTITADLSYELTGSMSTLAGDYVSTRFEVQMSLYSSDAGKIGYNEYVSNTANGWDDTSKSLSITSSEDVQYGDEVYVEIELFFQVVEGTYIEFKDTSVCTCDDGYKIVLNGVNFTS